SHFCYEIDPWCKRHFTFTFHISFMRLVPGLGAREKETYALEFVHLLVGEDGGAELEDVPEEGVALEVGVHAASQRLAHRVVHQLRRPRVQPERLPPEPYRQRWRVSLLKTLTN